VQIVSFTDNDSLSFVVGKIEFELAGKARVKNFLSKVLTSQITIDSNIRTMSTDRHANPFVSICVYN